PVHNVGASHSASGRPRSRAVNSARSAASIPRISMPHTIARLRALSSRYESAGIAVDEQRSAGIHHAQCRITGLAAVAEVVHPHIHRAVGVVALEGFDTAETLHGPGRPVLFELLPAAVGLLRGGGQQRPRTRRIHVELLEQLAGLD